MEQMRISVRDYHKEWVSEAEAFNLSGFVREHLDDRMPAEQVPEEHRPDARATPEGGTDD